MVTPGDILCSTIAALVGGLVIARRFIPLCLLVKAGYGDWGVWVKLIGWGVIVISCIAAILGLAGTSLRLG